VYLADVLPTLCDLTGVPIPDTVLSTSFAPVLRGDRDKIRDVMYGVYCGGTKPGIRAVRQGDWKLVKWDVLDGRVRKTQLFNLAENPHELLPGHHVASVRAMTRYQEAPTEIDLADDPRYATKRAQLEALLTAQMDAYEDPYRLWYQAPETDL
ncbi:MAG: sulfatase, partial [Planctomycetota bacterium]